MRRSRVIGIIVGAEAVDADDCLAPGKAVLKIFFKGMIGGRCRRCEALEAYGYGEEQQGRYNRRAAKESKAVRQDARIRVKLRMERFFPGYRFRQALD